MIKTLLILIILAGSVKAAEVMVYKIEFPKNVFDLVFETKYHPSLTESIYKALNCESGNREYLPSVLRQLVLNSLPSSNDDLTLFTKLRIEISYRSCVELIELADESPEYSESNILLSFLWLWSVRAIQILNKLPADDERYSDWVEEYKLNFSKLVFNLTSDQVIAKFASPPKKDDDDNGTGNEAVPVIPIIDPQERISSDPVTLDLDEERIDYIDLDAELEQLHELIIDMPLILSKVIDDALAKVSKFEELLTTGWMAQEHQQSEEPFTELDKSRLSIFILGNIRRFTCSDMDTRNEENTLSNYLIDGNITMTYLEYVYNERVVQAESITQESPRKEEILAQVQESNIDYSGLYPSEEDEFFDYTPCIRIVDRC